MSGSFSTESGVAWPTVAPFQQGGFAGGLEAVFDGKASPDIADYKAPIPFSIQGLQIFGGSIKLATDTPGRCDLLLRAAVIGDPALEGGLDAGSFLIMNYIVSVRAPYCDRTIEIPPCIIPCANGAIAVPPDGTGYQFLMRANVAGGGTGNIDVEVQWSGRWF